MSAIDELLENNAAYAHAFDRADLPSAPAKKVAVCSTRRNSGAWFHNLRSNPLVRLGGRPFRAEVITDDAERARLWDLADRVFPPYATYRVRAAAAGRVIAIVCLHPSSQ